ncbi:cytochrome C [Burkholderia ubonensis subsp. mesacidophila]|uniref:Cytochrome C n=2 Tax=Burkholderia ubonensis TaxID=101571 RepID=A0A2A4FKX7_9BURK|nr:cytochrome C [Burkholderia ubonensis subsp. mesacidophila]
MKNWKKIAGWSALGVAALAGVALALAWQPAIPPVDRVDAGSFDAAQVARGATLAALGDCAVCHTRADGPRNAGGLPMQSPFGTIYSTNITPDRDTGIGAWSFDAFRRAMRHGVDRTGRYLYPAFPYTAFTRITDDDLRALYAYLMTQPPVRNAPPPTRLAFPFNIRPGIAGWNLLFLRTGPVPDDATAGAEWNRGRYLVEGLGHCGACHSPRNLAYAELGGARHLGGGEAEGWIAPALTGASRAPTPWTAGELAEFMRHGFTARHGVAAGPMAPVVAEGLSTQSDADLRAMAAYLVSLPPHAGESAPTVRPEPSRVAIETAAAPGARLFAGACMACHAQAGGPTLYGVRPSLALNSNLHDARPDNAIRIVLDGIGKPAAGELGYMPAFRHNLNDRQIADLLNYLRTDLAGRPAWPGLEQVVGAVRAATRPVR